MPVKEKTSNLTQEKARLRRIWADILVYLKDLGNIWTDKVKQRFEELKTVLENIKFILEKNPEKYSSKLKAISNIEENLSKVEATRPWLRDMNKNIRTILETTPTMSRRGFLARAFAAGVGLALGRSSKARAAGRNLIITVYAVRPHRAKNIDYCRRNWHKPLSKYTDGAYNLVKEFYREKLGINLNFVYCKSESEVPKNLDRKNNAIFIEKQYKGVRGMSEPINEMNRAHSEGKSEKIMGKLWANVKFAGMREGGRIDLKNNKVCVKYVGDEWKNLFREEGSIEHAKRNLEDNKYRNDTQGIKWWEGRLKSYKNQLKYSSELLSDKKSAHLIAHELGHRFGLVHSFQYLDDDVEDYHGKVPNVMSYEKTNMDPHSKFGFGANESQKRIVIDFVSEGETYKLMVEAGWDFGKYCKLFEKKKGYKEFGKAPPSGLPF
ncbi:hypothetical protein KY331_03700 [Candidatus Woesearchaeota archaeon]|nr:hypothetical protein [Candidatus Woesearchaeota archaeon]